MRKQLINRLLVTSLALAAAGLLTCVACVLDIILPHATLAGFLGLLCTAAIVIVAIMVSFAWSFEKLENRTEDRLRRTKRDAENPPRAVTSDRRRLASRLARPAIGGRRPTCFTPIASISVHLPRHD